MDGKEIQGDGSLDAVNTTKANIASILNGLNHAFVNMAASLYLK
jgi:hypothetical protein